MTLPPEDATVDVIAESRLLLNTWCDRHAYDPICILYGGMRSINGLTDGWEEFLNALKQLRILAKEDGCLITPDEAAKVHLLIGVVSRALSR